MLAGKSRRLNRPVGLTPTRTRLTGIKLCECCGKFVVLLRWIRRDGTNGWRWCYFKNWDGDQYWVPGSAAPHPTRRRGKRIWVKPKPDNSLE
jgi:hypothetical protein